MTDLRALVAGIGNIFLGDDGFVVEVGRLTAVLPDTIFFCFNVYTEGTPRRGRHTRDRRRARTRPLSGLRRRAGLRAALGAVRLRQR